MFEQAFIVIYGAAVRPDGSPSGAMRDRVGAAVRFGRRLLPQPIYIPTGGQGRYGPTEAEVMTRLLLDRGIDPDFIVPEPTGTNTLSSTVAVARMLHGLTGPVYAATSAYHMPRCVLLLGMAGLDAHRSPSSIGPASSRIRLRWYWRLREIPAIPVDAALMLLRRWRGFEPLPESLPEQPDEPEEVQAEPVEAAAPFPTPATSSADGVLGTIMARFFGHSAAATTPAAAVDVHAILEDMAARHGEAPDWRIDIADLLAILEVANGPATRRTLADELHYPGDPDDLPARDAWLHATLMTRLGEAPPSALTHPG